VILKGSIFKDISTIKAKLWKEFAVLVSGHPKCSASSADLPSNLNFKSHPKTYVLPITCHSKQLSTVPIPFLHSLKYNIIQTHFFPFRHFLGTPKSEMEQQTEE